MRIDLGFTRSALIKSRNTLRKHQYRLSKDPFHYGPGNQLLLGEALGSNDIDEIEDAMAVLGIFSPIGYEYNTMDLARLINRALEEGEPCPAI